MDEISRGIATAALTLQSVLLQALVVKGTLSYGEGLEIVEKALGIAARNVRNKDEEAVADATTTCLEDVREGLVRMRARQ